MLSQGMDKEHIRTKILTLHKSNLQYDLDTSRQNGMMLLNCRKHKTQTNWTREHRSKT